MDDDHPASPAEAAQLDVLVPLVTGDHLTEDGLAHVRGLLLGPGFGSLPSRRVLVVVMQRLAEVKGWPAPDDPAWPPPDDPVWDVPVSGAPDDLSGLSDGW